jgi:TatD DNase family protein
MHCYSYSKEMAKDFLDMGFYIGVGGVVTFKNGKKLKEAVEYVPLERIVTETDSPYMAPVPMRGKRNTSEYLPYIVSEIAAIKGVTAEEVERVTFENAVRLFGK